MKGRRVPGILAAGLVLVLGAAEACGEILDAPAYPEPDAGGDPGRPETDGAPDARKGVDLGTCDRTKPFAPPTLVKGFPRGILCVQLSVDEQLAFYSVDGKSYVATRTDDGFAPPSPLAAEGNVLCPSLSADRTLLFHSEGFGVWRQRGAPGGPYGEKVAISAEGPDGAALDGIAASPFFDEARHQLYVTVVGAELARLSIAVAPVTDAGDVGPFQLVPITGPRELFPVVSGDGLRLYFGRATGALDAGDLDTVKNADIQLVARPDTEAAFPPTPVAVDNVSSGERDFPMWLSPDDCRLYLLSTRNRPEASAADTEVFVATRGR